MKEKPKSVQKMITVDTECFMYKKHSFCIDNSSILSISNHDNEVWISVTNERTGVNKETYLHLEIEKKSRFWKDLVTTINAFDKGANQ